MARIAKALAAHLSAWEKVQRIGWTRNEETGCLEYNGYRNEFGYGQFRVGKSLIRVHRLVYEKLVGPLASHEVVMHLCDNPSCCEVTHLSKGTQADNVSDMRSKNRGYKDDWVMCPNGHVYPPSRPKRINKNRCVKCTTDRNRKYLKRKQEAQDVVARS